MLRLGEDVCSVLGDTSKHRPENPANPREISSRSVNDNRSEDHSGPVGFVARRVQWSADDRFLGTTRSAKIRSAIARALWHDDEARQVKPSLAKHKHTNREEFHALAR